MSRLLTLLRKKGGDATSSLLVSDSFTDTNGTALASHTPDTDTVGGGWATTGAALTIQTNRAQVSSGTDALGLIDAGTADVSVTAEIRTTAPRGSLLARTVDLNNRWEARLAANTANTIYIVEVTAGTGTIRASKAYSIPSDTPFEVEFRAEGNVLTLYVGGVEELTYTSSVRNTVTTHGIYGNAITRWDDFTVTAL